jgi:hypothetical protein
MYRLLAHPSHWSYWSHRQSSFSQIVSALDEAGSSPRGRELVTTHFKGESPYVPVQAAAGTATARASHALGYVHPATVVMPPAES